MKEQTGPFKVGQAYLFRTVTNYITGKVVAVFDGEIVVQEAAWIADTGRFFNALKTGEFNEVEPFTDEVIIGRGSIIDATVWKHPLPAVQK